ncbi:rhodanese domain-containing protein CG4456-like [Macrobrachium nipponense]|uniref:rhodanese domain-containing protein CG4456-like n=1 Tax=Macrobrachium nipponense TaxID=159736 RepID=UPI0030C8C9CC
MVGELQALSFLVAISGRGMILSYLLKFVAKTETSDNPIPRSFVLKSLVDYVVFFSDIDYSELQRKLDSDEITLIDVRLPKERSEEGMIPKSKNIVLEALGPIILFPDEKFAKRFGFKKPALDDPIVVSCLGGVRARTAQLALMGVGYNNVRVYVGSFEDWITKGGPVVYPEPDS